MLAAKRAHKQMLKKQRAQWFERLNDKDEDSDEDYSEQMETKLIDNRFDNLNIELRKMGFNARTSKYYVNTASTRNIESVGSMIQNENGVSKRERDMLKTNTLRKTLTKLMSTTPTESRTWNATS
jgi:hypothetical protein